MDGFIPKPLRSGLLYETLARLTNLAGVSAPPDKPFTPETSSNADQSDLVPFNREELLERLQGNLELIPKFVALFIESVKEPIIRLKNAVNIGNCDDIHRLSHLIKGSSANISAPRIMKIAAALDDMAKSGVLDNAPHLLHQLESEYAAFKISAGHD
jgi:HPt (histidine-containing phosphotransfer) domain-containing protein